MLEAEREYECAKCQHRFRVFSDIEQRSLLELPRTCPAPAGPRRKRCSSSAFTYVEGSHVCRDYQEVKIQEQVQKLSMGSIPRSLLVVLQDDLVRRAGLVLSRAASQEGRYLHGQIDR